MTRATHFDPWLVGILGVLIIAYGIYQGWRVYRGSFEKELRLSKLSAGQRRWVLRICACGVAARGFVFCVVGVFFLQAGFNSDPGHARGLSGALSALSSEPYGRFVFATVALGLAAYGVYCWVKARYSSFGRI